MIGALTTDGTMPNLRHQASGGGTVTITSSVAIVNDTTWSRIVGTWRPGRLELYVDGWSRASSTVAATNSSALFGIYRWGWGFSTSQDFNGDIALIACCRAIGCQACTPTWFGCSSACPPASYYQHNLFRFHMVPVLPALFGSTLF
jgi:hypothetical protein